MLIPYRQPQKSPLTGAVSGASETWRRSEHGLDLLGFAPHWPRTERRGVWSGAQQLGLGPRPTSQPARPTARGEWKDAPSLQTTAGQRINLHRSGVFSIMASLPSDFDPLERRFLRRVEGVDQLPINPDLVLGGVHRFLHAQSIGTMFLNVKGEF